MSLRRLYNLVEAGIENEPTGKLRRKWRQFKPAELGLDADREEPFPPENPLQAEPKEPEKPVPFARQSAKPSPSLQGGKTAGTLKADRETLAALERALENVRTGDDDLQSWVDDLLSEIGRAIRKGGDVTLPKFVAAPDEDDDGEAPEDEDY